MTTDNNRPPRRNEGRKGKDMEKWRVNWCGNYSEFSAIFDTKEEAKKFYNSLITRNKKIYSVYIAG
jgi:hypothetical protein